MQGLGLCILHSYQSMQVLLNVTWNVFEGRNQPWQIIPGLIFPSAIDFLHDLWARCISSLSMSPASVLHLCNYLPHTFSMSYVWAELFQTGTAPYCMEGTSPMPPGYHEFIPQNSSGFPRLMVTSKKQVLTSASRLCCWRKHRWTAFSWKKLFTLWLDLCT